MPNPRPGADDLAYMQQAVSLSYRNWGFTRPNPSVGTVIVRNGEVISSAVTSAGGRPHSEAIALNRRGLPFAGATAYVTLEPCTHFGRTPPCCDLVIESGIRRVFIGCRDPNPLVNGRGVRKLRAAGVHAVTGVLEKECAEPNEWFFKRFHSRFPFVTVKTAVSLDGRIATRSEDSRWISCTDSLRYAHLLRLRSDAVLVGTNTIRRDNPTLNVRLVPNRGRNPHKIVLDRRGVLSDRLHIFRSFAGEEIFYFTAARIPRALSRNTYVRPFRIAERKSGLDLEEMMLVLRQNEVHSVLVEGGGELNGRLLDLGLIDKVEIVVAPTLVGGRGATSALEGEGVDRMKKAFNLQDVSWTPSGRDMIVKGYLRRYYR